MATIISFNSSQFLQPEIAFESSQELNSLYANYNLCAVTTLLALDIIETFPNEVVHIWKKKFGVFNLLYLITRYIPFFVHVVFVALTFMTSLNDISGVFAFDAITVFYGISWFTVLGCTEYLFIIRAVALNGRSRWLHYTLVALYVGEIIASVACFPFTVGGRPTSPIIQSTQFPGVTIFLAAFGIPELVFQFILVLVIIDAIIRHRKTWTWRGQRSLAIVIVRDGLWGYLFNLLGLLVVLFGGGNLLTGPLQFPSLQWSYVTLSVTSSRLLLNIRSGAETECPGLSSVKHTHNFSFFNGEPEDIQEQRVIENSRLRQSVLGC